jgi:parvulin-like peptidyl-prolyl isomerase
VDWRLRGGFGDVGQEIEQFLFAANVNDRSGVIPGAAGFYIVELTDKEARPLSDAQKTEYGSREMEEWLADVAVTHRVEQDLTEDDIRRVLDRWIS